MKPANFDYARPASIAEAVTLLAGSGDAKVLAGGQTLGPLLNLRLVQPALLVDITRIPELVRVEESRDAIVLGASITHAAIEDGRVPDPTGGLMARVARGIAYRAVRTRGTIGGSIAHADPAADWLPVLMALGAEVLITGPEGQRRARLADFVEGAMATTLGPSEVLDGVCIPKGSRRMRSGFHKMCRKAGEFADAIGVVVEDPDRGVREIVSGATGGRPMRVPAPDIEAGTAYPGRGPSAALAAWKHVLQRAGFAGDAYELQIHAVALARAFGEASRA